MEYVTNVRLLFKAVSANTFTGHTGPALAAEFLVPCSLRMVFAETQPIPRQTLQSGSILDQPDRTTPIRVNGRVGQQQPAPFAALHHANDVVEQKLRGVVRLTEFT
jgi:hypothetical protein